MSGSDEAGGGSGPPGLARRFLALICPPGDRRFIVSDLAEEFAQRMERDGPSRARRWYRWQVLRSLLPCMRRRATLALRRTRRGVLADLTSDLRYAVRRLGRTPVQLLVMVASLGIGIGLTTSVFSVANAFLLQDPGGVEDTEGLVALFTSDEEGGLYGANSFPDFRDVEERVGLFEGVAAIRPGIVRWTGERGSERVVVEAVTGDYFRILRVSMALGRDFLPEETIPGRAEQRVVLSHDFWEERFRGRREVLGETIRLESRDFVVIGVAPEGLGGRFLRLEVDAWVPLGMPGGFYHSTAEEIADREAREYLVYARLRPDVAMERAREGLQVLASRLRDEHGRVWGDDRGRPRTFSLLKEKEARIPPDGRAAMAGSAGFLLAGTGLVLLLACANVAGLFLARGSRRAREIAVRFSLGAGRRRLVRLFLVEGLVVALGGGLVGVGIASRVAGFLDAVPMPLDAPLSFDVGLDWRVVLFALGASVAATLAFGLVPALRSTGKDVLPALKGDHPRAKGVAGGHLFRNLLVVLQVTGSVVLLAGAALFLRSVRADEGLPRGVEVAGIAVASHTVRDAAVDMDGVRRRILDLAGRVEEHPDVTEVQVASGADLSTWAGGHHELELEVEGHVPSQNEPVVVGSSSVTPGYFEMLGVTPLRGRALTPDDGLGGPFVAVVNQAFLRRYWPDSEGPGRRLTVRRRRFMGDAYQAPERSFTVVGVLPDLRSSPAREAEPFVWLSYLQEPTRSVVLHARGRKTAGAAVPVLRTEIEALSDDLELVAPRTYDDLLTFELLPQRLASSALGAAGVFALLLAAMGIYGVISFTVSQRTREMAVRQALGAGRGRVLSSLLIQGMTLAATGVSLGLAVAVPGAFMIRSVLHGVSPMDPLALAGAGGVLFVTALVATLVPARRAAGIDPMTVLRQE